jgi:hypothetical protein
MRMSGVWEDATGAWEEAACQVHGAEGLVEWQEGGRSWGRNDIVRDERIWKGAEGIHREATPSWAVVLKFLAMPLSPPALSICLPVSAFWPRRSPPSPASPSLPTNGPGLSPTREMNLLLPFPGLCASCSSSLQASGGV